MTQFTQDASDTETSSQYDEAAGMIVQQAMTSSVQNNKELYAITTR